MAIVEEREVCTPSERLLTVADVAVLPTRLPSGDVDYELLHGRLVIVMSPTGQMHGGYQLRIGAALYNQGEQRGLGRAFTEASVVLSRNPDTVVTPDVLFVAQRSLPLRESPEGYLETIPNLVVEIRSKNDSLRALEEKARLYLTSGVELFWLVDPPRKTIVAHRRDGSTAEFGPTAILTADGILPDFRLALTEIFAA